eukprot:13511059-Heterocapsa_arctica.AAC.1
MSWSCWMDSCTMRFFPSSSHRAGTGAAPTVAPQLATALSAASSALPSGRAGRVSGAPSPS